MRKRWLWLVLLFVVAAALVFALFAGKGRATSVEKTAVDQATDTLRGIYLSMQGTPVDRYEAYIARVPGALYEGETLAFPIRTDSEGEPAESEGVSLSEIDEKKAICTVTAPQDGLYALAFAYRPEGKSVLQTVLSFAVDGTVPYDELSAVQANNTWVSEGFPQDRYGNECVAMPLRDNQAWKRAYVRSVSGLYSQPMLVYLTAGEHTVSIACEESAITVSTVYLCKAPSVPDAPTQAASGDGLIWIEAERIARRSTPNTRTGALYSTQVTPYSSGTKVQNYLEDASFRYGGALVEYDFTAPRDGYYDMRLYYRQADKNGFTVFRNIYVDGEIPNQACVNMPFAFSRSFSQTQLPAPLYLTAGAHTLGIEVSLDPTRYAILVLKQAIVEMNDLTLDISRITGGNTERYRDFVLSDYGIDAGPKLIHWAEQLEQTYDALALLKSVDGDCGEIKPLKVASSLLRLLAKEPNELPKRLAQFSRGTLSDKASSASSASVTQYLTNLVESLQLSQLGLDKIVLYQDQATLPKSMGMFEALGKNLSHFFHSFGVQEYTPAYDGNKGEAVQIWVNRPRQYLEIMQNMIDTDFTPRTGIKVELSILPDQYKLVLANASNKAPDAALSIASGGVYDLAIRGALQDMRKFDGFKEVARRFSPGMLIPGVLDDGCYAIPETFNFWVMFYRSDILGSLGLKVPDTLEEVRDLLPQLRRMGMNYNCQVSNFVFKPFSVTSPFIFQNGASVYRDGTGLSALDTPEAIEAMTQLTENYNVYNMQFLITSFYQYFRDGRTPIGVSDYGTFNLLTNAAPELAGKWELAPYPGVRDENGVVQRWTSGAAESNVIFDSSAHKKEAWAFLDWWMSTQAQTDFAFLLQTTLGNEYLWNSANLEALGNAPWNRKHKAVILEQLKWAYETPRVPGGYMAEREISSAIDKVVSDGIKLQTAIDTAVRNVDREIKRKMEEFGYTKDGVYIKPFRLPTIQTVEDWLK